MSSRSVGLQTDRVVGGVTRCTVSGACVGEGSHPAWTGEAVLCYRLSYAAWSKTIKIERERAIYIYIYAFLYISCKLCFLWWVNYCFQMHFPAHGVHCRMWRIGNTCFPYCCSVIICISLLYALMLLYFVSVCLPLSLLLCVPYPQHPQRIFWRICSCISFNILGKGARVLFVLA